LRLPGRDAGCRADAESRREQSQPERGDDPDAGAGDKAVGDRAADQQAADEWKQANPDASGVGTAHGLKVQGYDPVAR
jgi:hypothetical protein